MTGRDRPRDDQVTAGGSEQRLAPFRFAVVASGAPDARTWCETARRAEGLGYAVLLVNDHIKQPLAPMPALAAAGAVTTTLRVGTYVLASDLRHPVAVAKEACSLDVLTDGRFELGLGTGWLADDYQATGVTPLTPRERVARFEEAFGIIADLLGGQTVHRAGAVWTVSDVALDPGPVQSPRPPLLVGASRRRMLSFAGRWADAVSISLLNVVDDRLHCVMPEELDQKIGWITAAAAGRSRRPEIDLVLWRCFVTGRPADLAGPLARVLGLAPEDVPRVPGLLVGSVDDIVQELTARRIRWGASMVSVPVDAMDAMAPVVARLAGT